MRVTVFSGQGTAVEVGPIVIPGAYTGGASLPFGQLGQVVGYGPGGVPQAMDLPAPGAAYDDADLRARIEALERAQGQPVTIITYTDAAEAEAAAASAPAHQITVLV